MTLLTTDRQFWHRGVHTIQNSARLRRSRRFLITITRRAWKTPQVKVPTHTTSSAYRPNSECTFSYGTPRGSSVSREVAHREGALEIEARSKRQGGVLGCYIQGGGSRLFLNDLFLNTNNARMLARRKTCILLYFIHGPPPYLASSRRRAARGGDALARARAVGAAVGAGRVALAHAAAGYGARQGAAQGRAHAPWVTILCRNSELTLRVSLTRFLVFSFSSFSLFLFFSFILG